MSEKIETQGKTVDAAVNEALLRLGARRDEVDVTVLEEPKGGFLGILGGRPAKVEVSKKRGRRSGQRKDSKDEAYGFGDNSKSNRGRRGGRNNRRGPRRENTSPKEETTQATQTRKEEPKSADGNRKGSSERKQRSDSDRRPRNRRPRQQEAPTRNQENNGNENKPREERRPRNTRQERQPRQPRQDNGPRQDNEARRDNETRQERRPRNARPARGEQAAQAQNNDRPAREERSEQPAARDRNERQGEISRGRQDRQERQDRNESRPPRAARVALGPPDEIIATGINVGKYAKAIRDIPSEELNNTLESMTTGLLVRAGFPARCEVSDGEYQQVRVITGDDSAGMLIGRHGATIDSVEHLVERMISMAAGDRVRMNLDINNYRLRRHESLLERVEDAVARVRESGKTYHVEPMNARERRIVHLAVEEFDGLRTFTMDGHSGRHVVIALDNNAQDETKDPEAINEAIARADASAMESGSENESRPASADEPTPETGGDDQPLA